MGKNLAINFLMMKMLYYYISQSGQSSFFMIKLESGKEIGQINI
jgi:hypothetical protein